jgi:hypothetical protein
VPRSRLSTPTARHRPRSPPWAHATAYPVAASASTSVSVSVGQPLRHSLSLGADSFPQLAAHDAAFPPRPVTSEAPSRANTRRCERIACPVRGRQGCWEVFFVVPAGALPLPVSETLLP